MSNQAYDLGVLPITANQNLTRYRFVDASGNVATSGGNAAGVAYTTVNSGLATTIGYVGVYPVEAEHAIARGAAIQVGPAGRAMNRQSGTIVARAWEAAAAGDIFQVLMVPN